jgi:hypothetical protein
MIDKENLMRMNVNHCLKNRESRGTHQEKVNPTEEVDIYIVLCSSGRTESQSDLSKYP